MRRQLILISVMVFFSIYTLVLVGEETKPGQTGGAVVVQGNPPNCPDLGAEMITFEIVKKIDPKTVRVKITGKVKNVGSKDFRSGPNQVIAQFFEGSRTPDNVFKVVAEKEILSLPAGEFFPLEYERDWEIADLEKFDSQPYYRLELKYSPDILKDNNPENDDCVAKNSKRERTSKELRRIWAATKAKEGSL